MTSNILPRLAMALVLGLVSTVAIAEPECGSLQNAYGPFDYRTSQKQLHIVEAFHFTPDVESLRRGNTSSLGGDIDYTLRASPNHHRALLAMMNLAFRDHTDQPKGAHYTIDCYFKRAIRMAPDDGEVQALYGVYLARTHHEREAAAMLEHALKDGQDNANTHYNLGLVYFDLKDYPKALEQAQRAYEMGVELQGLRDKLQAAGLWRDSAARTSGATRSNGSSLGGR